MRIYTLTLSPAYDVHADSAGITACHENLATVRSREAGGKGVNISRALASYGISNTAVVVLGAENCTDFRRDLELAGLDAILIEVPGRIRENLTIHCPDQPETRISFTGFSVEKGLLARIGKAMEIDDSTFVTLTGRVPEGITMEEVKSFLKDLKEKGARIVVDSRSFGVEDILDVGPWLIKPNQEEIGMFFGCPVETMEQAVEKGNSFASGGVENVMISMGKQGAILITAEGSLVAKPPVIPACSSVGAGDSMIAGFLAAVTEEKEITACLQTAVAFGTAACLTEGTQPPRKEDILRISEKINVMRW